MFLCLVGSSLIVAVIEFAAESATEMDFVPVIDQGIKTCEIQRTCSADVVYYGCILMLLESSAGNE